MATTERPRNIGEVLAESLAKAFGTYAVSKQQKQDDEVTIARERLAMFRREQERQVKAEERTQRMAEIDLRMKKLRMEMTLTPEQKAKLGAQLQQENQLALEKAKQENQLALEKAKQENQLALEKAKQERDLAISQQKTNQESLQNQRLFRMQPASQAQVLALSKFFKSNAEMQALNEASSLAGVPIKSGSEIGAYSVPQKSYAWQANNPASRFFADMFSADDPAVEGMQGMSQKWNEIQQANWQDSARAVLSPAQQATGMQENQPQPTMIQTPTKPGLSKAEAVAKLKALGWTDEEIRAGKRNR